VLAQELLEALRAELCGGSDFRLVEDGLLAALFSPLVLAIKSLVCFASLHAGHRTQ
jgi:hypothetical protein